MEVATLVSVVWQLPGYLIPLEVEMEHQFRTKVLWAKETELPSKRGNLRTQHTFYHLYLLRSGNAIQYYGDQPYLMTDGHCLMVHPYVMHETPKDTHNLLDFYEIKFEIYDEHLDKMMHDIAPHFKVTPFIETAMQYILSHWSQTGNQSQIDVDDMLSAMLLHICDTPFSEEWTSDCVDTTSYGSKVKQIIRHIEKKFDEPFRLNHLAEELNLNPTNMCNIFKKQTGHTIIDYLNYIRIRSAVNAFYYGNDSIVDVALDVGFTSATHFNRIFRKYLGTTPSNCRKYFSSRMNSMSDNTAHIYEEKIEFYIAPSMGEAFKAMRNLGALANEISNTENCG